MRIDLAGATLDIWPLYLYHANAQTLNVAISLRARCWLRTRGDRRLVLRSLDTNGRTEADRWSSLPADPAWRLLRCILGFFEAEGLDVVTQSDSPIGAGIAGSSALNVATCAALARWKGCDLPAERLLSVAMNLEAQAIGVPTGAQDYRPAYYGGVSAVELGVGGVSRVALKVDPVELQRRLILAYTGVSRQSGINNWQVMKDRIDGAPGLAEHFDEICRVAADMRRALEAADWPGVGHQIAAEWELRKRLTPGVTTPAIDDLIARAGGAGALGSKVCGAGGGGCIAAFADPSDVEAVTGALAEGGARILSCEVDTEGLRLVPGGTAPTPDWPPWTNSLIARVFGDIGDLLELKAANPFKIRAYRAAADLIGNMGERAADLSTEELRAIPGIGKDLAARIRELAETGRLTVHRELLEEFPPTILDLLHLQGVGPKTVALLYRELDIGSLEALEAAAQEGRLRTLKGLGPKKEQLILRAVGEYRRREGRYPMPDVQEIAEALSAHLRQMRPALSVTPVGSLRRGCDTCGDVDLLVTGADPELLECFTGYDGVERVLGQGETKASVLLTNGLQADLRMVPPDSVGAALQYFTGSKAHNIALRDRAVQRGLKLNEYGVFRQKDGDKVAGDSEESVYDALGLPFIPPELREHRGEIAAAEANALPRLIVRNDLRGDVHTHTTESDGRADVQAMANAARDAGLDYLAVTDHSKSLAMANGLDEHRALAHARRVREFDAQIDGITLLAGIECDILADGTLDLAEECLAQLDIVVASVHSAFAQEERQMTDRLLRAIESPVVDIIGHPTGRLLRRREPYRVDVEALVTAAAAHGVALEINSQANRLDLNDAHAKLARDRGVPLVISSDAHAPAGFGVLRWGIVVARRAWLEAAHVLNTKPVDAFRAALRRNARG